MTGRRGGLPAVLVLALLLIPGRAPVADVAQLIDALVEQDLGWLGWEAAPSVDALKQRDTAQPASAMARIELGAAYAAAGEWRSAQRTLERARGELEQTLGGRDFRLFLPTLLLARIHAENGRPYEAVDEYARARTLTHRRWGGNNLAQLPIVNEQADLLTRAGERWQAEELLRFAARLTEDAYGPASLEAVAANVELGQWLRAGGDYKAALSHYRSAMKDVRALAGGDAPALVYLLRGRALAYLGGPLRGRSIGDLRRATDLMDQHPDVFDPDDRIRSRVELGDLLMVFSYEGAATREYEKAWELADGSPGQRHWLEVLAEPHLVRYRTFFPAREGTQVDAELRFAFDVTDDGRPRRAEVVESTADGAVNYYAPWIFASEARFRPAIVEGRAVPAADQQLTLALGSLQPETPLVRSMFQNRARPLRPRPVTPIQ